MPMTMPINALVDLLQAVLPEMEKFGNDHPEFEFTDKASLFSFLDDAVIWAAAGNPSLLNTLTMHVDDLHRVIRR